MTKLLKVNCGVCFDGYLPEADEDYNPWIMEVERYYTSEDIAEAFVFAEKRKLEFTFSKDYCFDFQKEWVEVDETEIPEQARVAGSSADLPKCSILFNDY